ncbi:PIN domain-containing protein [Nitrospirillum iridis]|uniref:Putative nucleic acid-binding protein n=1 Tax=Nitrospirillum iridis TaxID=765888 RepID=A0A7X0B0M1_9PROT|nr:putative nucleic acid-binding protein [Nitrospirillum iridis]
MTVYTALLDANVLYPAPMRDLLMQLAVMDVFHAKWSADIHREWIEALMRTQPYRDRAKLEQTRDQMDRATRDCVVTGYQGLIASLTLPDPNDRHVLAAAIKGRCDAIVTQNLADFPEAALAPYGIEALHPDDFLLNQMSLDPAAFCTAVAKVRARLKNPPYSVEDYLATLTRQGLVATAGELRQYAALL